MSDRYFMFNGKTARYITSVDFSNENDYTEIEKPENGGLRIRCHDLRFGGGERYIYFPKENGIIFYYVFSDIHDIFYQNNFLRCFPICNSKYLEENDDEKLKNGSENFLCFSGFDDYIDFLYQLNDLFKKLPFSFERNKLQDRAVILSIYEIILNKKWIIESQEYNNFKL